MSSLIHRLIRSALLVGIATQFVAAVTSAQPAEGEHQLSAEEARRPIQALTRLTSLRDLKQTQTAMTTPAVQSWQTQQGSRVLFVQTDALPIVDVRLTFDAGSARDSELRAGLFGLAHLTASMLDEGTTTRRGDEIAAGFEQTGAQYQAAAYRDMFTIELRTLSAPAQRQSAVTLLLDILQNANFPDDAYARIRQNQLVGQKQRFDSPAAIAQIRFFREAYGNHPYAQPSTGTTNGLNQITTADIRAFKQRYLVSRNLNIAITGQLSRAEAAALAEQLSAALPVGEHAAPLPAPTMQSARTVRVPYDAEQTNIIIGQPAVTRLDPAVPALLVGNEILGGGDFNADLMTELREKRGLTYGAYSGFGLTRSQGPFTISYATRASEAETSLQVAQETLKRFLTRLPEASRVEEVKSGLINAFPLGLSSNASINGYLGLIGFYGLPDSYLADYPKRIAQVTPQAIQAAFASHVKPDQLITVVVGRTNSTPSPSDSVQPAASQPSAEQP